MDPVCPLKAALPLPTVEHARAVRDGGIDAMAALDSALAEAIEGLDAGQARELKQVFGRVMGEICLEIINQAVRAYPELEPDAATWAAVARERATWRGAGATPDPSGPDAPLPAAAPGPRTPPA